MVLYTIPYCGILLVEHQVLTILLKNFRACSVLLSIKQKTKQKTCTGFWNFPENMWSMNNFNKLFATFLEATYYSRTLKDRAGNNTHQPAAWNIWKVIGFNKIQNHFFLTNITKETKVWNSSLNWVLFCQSFKRISWPDSCWGTDFDLHFTGDFWPCPHLFTHLRNRWGADKKRHII